MHNSLLIIFLYDAVLLLFHLPLKFVKGCLPAYWWIFTMVKTAHYKTLMRFNRSCMKCCIRRPIINTFFLTFCYGNLPKSVKQFLKSTTYLFDFATTEPGERLEVFWERLNRQTQTRASKSSHSQLAVIPLSYVYSESFCWLLPES